VHATTNWNSFRRKYKTFHCWWNFVPWHFVRTPVLRCLYKMMLWVTKTYMQNRKLRVWHVCKYLIEGPPVAARWNDVEDCEVRLPESEIPSCIWDMALYHQVSCSWSYLEGIRDRRREDTEATLDWQTVPDRSNKLQDQQQLMLQSPWCCFAVPAVTLEVQKQKHGRSLWQESQPPQTDRAFCLHRLSDLVCKSNFLLQQLCKEYADGARDM